MNEYERPELAEELARAVYRLTDVLSPEEPLRKKLREAALDVAILLQPSHEAGAARLGSKIDELMVLLAVGRHQGFAKEGNFIALAEFYQRLQEKNAGPSRPAEHASSATTAEPHMASHSEALNQRQKKIIQHFRHRDSFQLREVRVLFEGYSQKTLRNDLKELCQKGILAREGVGTVSRYRVITSNA